MSSDRQIRWDMSKWPIGEPIQIDGGWRVRETEHYYIDVMLMLFGNTRIVLTPKSSPLTYDRGWCYDGPLIETVLRCATFDPELGEEPSGWVKEVSTERRACAAYHRIKDGHTHYDPDCPDCGNEALY